MTCLSTAEMLSCTACSLHTSRNLVVPGHGNPDADIAFVAEAPGFDEDMHGEPLIGPAGRRFDRHLAAVGLRREDCWLDNAVHCRPPDNRLRDYPDAQMRCPGLWLFPVLQQVKPKVVVAMGRTAGSLWFPGIDAHGLSELARYTAEYTVIGALHPSYALRLGGEWNDADDSIVASIRRARALVDEGVTWLPTSTLQA